MLVEPDAFAQQVSELIERVKATPRQPGVGEIRIPGEWAFRSRERALRAGIEGRVINSAVPLPTFRDGLATMQVMDAIRQSAAQGGALVRLD